MTIDQRMTPWRETAGRQRWALVPLQLVVGFGLAYHGYAKLSRGPEGFAGILAAMGIPAPSLMAWATTLFELVGGGLLMMGAFVVLLSIPLVVIMATAMFGVHFQYGYSSIRLKAVTSAGAQFGPVGYELNLLYIAALVTLALAGPSLWSIDRWRASRRAQKTPDLSKIG